MSIADIKREVGRHYHISQAEMVSTDRTRDVARGRQVAMYLSHALGSDQYAHSKSNIGRLFGGRDHSTVFHACQAVEHRMASDEKECAKVVAVMIELGIDRAMKRLELELVGARP